MIFTAHAGISGQIVEMFLFVIGINRSVGDILYRIFIEMSDN